MKVFTELAFAASFITASLAQRIVIGYPPDGYSVKAGSDLVVELDRPVSSLSFEFK